MGSDHGNGHWGLGHSGGGSIASFDSDGYDDADEAYGGYDPWVLQRYDPQTHVSTLYNRQTGRRRYYDPRARPWPPSWLVTCLARLGKLVFWLAFIAVIGCIGSAFWSAATGWHFG
jgi:hypothetical protein